MIVLLGLTDGDGRQRARASGSPTSSRPPLAEQIDWEATYVNCFTAGGAGVRRARLPMVLPDEESCIRAALQTCGRPFDEPQAGRAHPLDAAPDALLGQRRPARRAPCGRRRRRRRRRRTPWPRDVLHDRATADGSEWFVADRPRPRAVGPRRLPRRPADGAARAGARAGAAGAAPGPHLGRPRAAGADGRVHDRRPRSCGPAGRPATRAAAIVDGDGKVRATATGMHVAVSRDAAVRAARSTTAASSTPRLADAAPGDVPDRAVSRHGRPGVPRRRRDPLPAGRGPRPRRDDGVDAHGAAAARRGAVAVPADQPARRLRQRLQPPRRARPRCSSSTPTSSSPSTAIRSASGWAAGPSSRVAADGRRARRRPAVRRRGPGRPGPADAAAAAGADDRRSPAALAEVVGRRPRRSTTPTSRRRTPRDWTGRFRGEALARRPARPTPPRSPPCCGACAARRRRRSCRRAATPASSAAACRAATPMVVLSTRRLDDARRRRRRRAAGDASAPASRWPRWRDHARAAGLDAPVDFASRDSATVGGAVATNAGGSRVVRFGTMRAQVAGARRPCSPTARRSARSPGCRRRPSACTGRRCWPAARARSASSRPSGCGSCRGTGTRRRRWWRRRASTTPSAVLAAPARRRARTSTPSS